MSAMTGPYRATVKEYHWQDGVTGRDVYVDGARGRVAMVYGNDLEAQATGKLLAASWQLLEACKTAHGTCKAALLRAEHEGCTAPALERLAAQLAAAIDAATGQPA